MIGVGIHSFIDEAIYCGTFSVNAVIGFYTATGKVLHEFPETIVTYVMLIKAGFSARIAFTLALVSTGFTIPLEG